MPTGRIDLNCDMGEGFGAWTMGDDPAMLDVVTSANIACGFHAGDPMIMTETVRAALERKVQIGAHPAFNDLAGFGRRAIAGIGPREIERLVAYQIGALQGCAALVGHRVGHVKPHGALYNLAAVEPDIAAAIVRAIRAVDRSLTLVGPPASALEAAGGSAGLRVAREVFADRSYEDDGQLTPRSQPGAVIHDAAVAAQRVVGMVVDRTIICRSGKRLALVADTVCVHGDTPGAVAIARSIRAALEAAGCTVAPLASAAMP
ncbi:MAG: 5-oxoprolinase subunit PxpA [Azospirillum sp.]|nr:5-oxoprolinase subunit PxpA [Azospirillum sp.]